MKSRISSLCTAVAVAASVSRFPADAQTDPTTSIPTFAVTSPTTVDGGGATSFPTSDFVESSYLPTYDSSSGGTGGTPAPSPMEEETTTLPPIVELITAPSTVSPDAAATATDPPAVSAGSTEFSPVAPVPTPSVTEAPAGGDTVSPVGSGGSVESAEKTSSSSSSSAAASLCVATTAAAAVWTMY
jgi:hypothetical protein